MSKVETKIIKIELFSNLHNVGMCRNYFFQNQKNQKTSLIDPDNFSSKMEKMANVGICRNQKNGSVRNVIFRTHSDIECRNPILEYFPF